MASVGMVAATGGAAATEPGDLGLRTRLRTRVASALEGLRETGRVLSGTPGRCAWCGTPTPATPPRCWG
jgi:hypothetical protein